MLYSQEVFRDNGVHSFLVMINVFTGGRQHIVFITLENMPHTWGIHFAGIPDYLNSLGLKCLLVTEITDC